MFSLIAITIQVFFGKFIFLSILLFTNRFILFICLLFFFFSPLIIDLHIYFSLRFMLSFNNLLICLLIYLFMNLFDNLLIYLFIYSLIYLSINLLTYSFTHFYYCIRDVEYVSQDTKVVWIGSPPIFPFKPRDFCTVKHFEKIGKVSSSERIKGW